VNKRRATGLREKVRALLVPYGAASEGKGLRTKFSPTHYFGYSSDIGGDHPV
jgi:hypothetical protein